MSGSVICCIKTVRYRKICCITETQHECVCVEWERERLNKRIKYLTVVSTRYHLDMHCIVVSMAIWASCHCVATQKDWTKMKNALTWSKWTWNCIVILRENVQCTLICRAVSIQWCAHFSQHSDKNPHEIFILFKEVKSILTLCKFYHYFALFLKFWAFSYSVFHLHK